MSATPSSIIRLGPINVHRPGSAAIRLMLFTAVLVPSMLAWHVVGWQSLFLFIPLYTLAACGAWKMAEFGLPGAANAARLAALIDDVQGGRAPIDELNRITGSLAPVAGAAARVFRELRLREKDAVALEHEIKQRLANRTDAMERVIGKLRQQATRDPLTGLFNRRMLEQHLAPLMDHCHKDNTPLTVLAIDMDNFKTLNDTLGHAAGDEFLRDTGQLIRSAAREGDLSFRTGGDEFVIVLPGCDRAAAEGLGRRLAALLDQRATTLRVKLKPGISFGVSALGEVPDTSAADLLARADAAVYQQKAARKAAARPVNSVSHSDSRVSIG